jgi:GNAT superfamily N-acetyltransferase
VSRTYISLDRVTEALPEGFAALQAEASGEGFRMLDRLARDWEAGADRYARDGEALLAARVDGALAGIGGLTHDPVLMDALRMRRFYVGPRFRRLGVARRLADALLALPRSHRTLITVNAGTPDAPAFWEALGFVRDSGGSHTHVLRGPVQQGVACDPT